MNKEPQSIIRNIQNVLNGEPWFGRSVFAILNEIDPAIVYKKPNPHSHSLAELLYHMNTWAEFCLRQIESRDWRNINPSVHTWQKGLDELKKTHDQIIEALESKDDEWLKEKVHFRNFNFRFMLNGLIQHDIYHLGQIAYVKKLLS